MLHMSQAFRLRTGNSKRRLLWLGAFGRQDLFGCWRGKNAISALVASTCLLLATIPSANVV